MAKPDPVARYIAEQPKAAQDSLARVRRAILKAVPEAEESIAYNMPAYKLRGAKLLQFAGCKNHFSLYFGTDRIVAALGGELSSYKIQKGTISFPLTEPVPEKLIERIATFRANELAHE